jgi:hypothetical protein
MAAKNGKVTRYKLNNKKAGPLLTLPDLFLEGKAV